MFDFLPKTTDEKVDFLYHIVVGIGLGIPLCVGIALTIYEGLSLCFGWR